ncbi:hypothetical protein [Sabulicella glaciei]|uniref:Lipoprotein n=1 Tax=Sabulicella glaciei TaxID=2984948 RepID=A0ABT3NRX6_9PROT|nr:hypothetical protein [Roseococcus sp. MDT2-1-1]MCW8084608.1 hypothetical protein [Roseococcus sp. MDT2-1-1]
MTRIHLALLLAPLALVACDQGMGGGNMAPRAASDTAAAPGVRSALPQTTVPQATGNTSTGQVTSPSAPGRASTAAGSGSAATGMR